MDFSGGLVIGRIRGIEIRLHWSWLLIFTLLTWLLSRSLFPEFAPEASDQRLWIAAIATALLFFLSVLLHELSHAFVAQYYGMHVPSITLFVFGGVSALTGEMKTARQEFWVAIAGPLMSWVLGLLAGGLWLLLRDTGAALTFGYLAWINVALGIFNLLPGFPLDGGRVLRAFLWGRSNNLVSATRWAARVGTGLAWLMIVGGIINVFAFGLVGGFWYVLIGLFLKAAAEGSYRTMLVDRALQDVTVGQVMRPPPDPIAPSLSLAELVEYRVLGSGERAFLVANDVAVLGLMSSTDLNKAPRERWSLTPVTEVMVPAADVATVQPSTPLLDALRVMQERDIHQLPVLDDGRLIGWLTRGEVIRQIELRMRFEEGRD
jgi:Zn-dependent protease